MAASGAPHSLAGNHPKDADQQQEGKDGPCDLPSPTSEVLHWLGHFRAGAVRIDAKTTRRNTSTKIANMIAVTTIVRWTIG